ncbi:hypothetical protein GCM10022267_25810 [Lentzea roselyniae]|uniref:Uncharacterized protein n=1 Tax=Lentzea roselyniae TaxID=531940 RepID=A0ABP7AQ97_9PSEU
MTAVPTPVLLIGLALAVLAVLALWKLLLTAGAIIGLEWVLITSTEDTTTQFVALAVPALLAAYAVSKVLPVNGHRTAPATTGSAGRKEVHQ